MRSYTLPDCCLLPAARWRPPPADARDFFYVCTVAELALVNGGEQVLRIAGPAFQISSRKTISASAGNRWLNVHSALHLLAPE